MDNARVLWLKSKYFVRSRSLYPFSITLISLAISSCGSISPGDPVAEETPPPVVTTNKARPVPVIERLVSEARQFGNAPVEGEPNAEPITTTIPMTANRVVERTINDFLQNRRGMLRMWVGRSYTYFPMIEKIFEEEGVPDELKYLALGESSLNPVARSPAGAVGMWQFMAGTARGEGLRVDSWVDERLDPELSTRAAAQHIKALNKDYNGRWHLSVAGYNCSYRCISKAVEKAGGSIEDPPTYWDIYPNLPRETREFVPKFIAAALIVSNPQFYGIETEDFGQELAYDIVRVKGMLSLEDAARYAGTDLATIKALNPALLKSSLPEDDEPYALKLPLGSHDHFVAAFNAAPPASKAGTGEYVVKKGDTLDAIARAYQSTVSELQEANNIRGHIIQINQKLLIPGMAGNGEIKLASTEREFVAWGGHTFQPIDLGDEFQIVRQSGTEDAPLLAVSLRIEEPEEGAMALVPTIYKVRSGDTLGGIAQQFGVSVASIQQANSINGYLIFPEQELTIHSAASVAAAAQAITYEVQRGDSLYQIAQKFNTSVDNLKRANKLNSNLIRVGQSLQVN
jgi:membrane-bound lytic murein transglycosylase D